MKVKVLSLLVPALLVAGTANAAEIYNKNGNKLDLYGKVDGLHYFSDDAGSDGDQTYVRTVSGNTTFRLTTPKVQAIRPGLVWHSQVSVSLMPVLSTTVVTTALSMM